MTTTLVDEITFRLQAAIFSGEYPPGTRMAQDELCERFGVSRTPVREALRRLEAQHLVDHVANKGATVRLPTRRELIDVYTLRAELEGFACELACRTIGPVELARLDEAHETICRAVLIMAGEPPTLEREAQFNVQITTANERFHGVIHRLAENERLRLMLRDLQHFFPKDYVWKATQSSDEAQELHIDDHERIRDALARRARRAARKAMEEHIGRAQAILVAYLDRQGFWS